MGPCHLQIKHSEKEMTEKRSDDLQATVRVALRLLACPAALRATHQYVPASPPPLPLRPPPRLCVTRRKKSAPSGRTSRCPRGSNASPSRYQVTSGGGIPSKAQRRVAGSLRKTVTFVGSSIIRGGTRTPPPPPLPLLPAISRRNEKRKREKYNSLCIQVIGELEFPNRRTNLVPPLLLFN